MNITIIGIGVIGCGYGWQLCESGNQITHFVREGQSEQIAKDGLRIHCLDARNPGKPFLEVCYRPNVTERINNSCDLIIVPIKANQLQAILPILSGVRRDVDILFLQNLWVNHLHLIEKHLPDAQVIYGQPHIMGGGKDNNTITCAIFGNKNAPTMLGKKDGSTTDQVLRVEQLMRQAGLNPKISKNILAWLFTHYAEANGLVAGVMEAGSAARFISNPRYVDHSIQIIREGFKVCTGLNIDAWQVYPQLAYYFPSWMLIPSLMRMYRSEESQLMIQGHISHSPDEMKAMFYDVLNTGQALGLPMTNYKRFQPYVDRFSI